MYCKEQMVNSIGKIKILLRLMDTKTNLTKHSCFRQKEEQNPEWDMVVKDKNAKSEK